MQIAQALAGYTLGDADNLRRAMGKKKKSEMDKERERFVTGAVERKLAEKLAREIFDQMETFAAYGFNKSHSAAYALVSYQTAYLKAHYPEEFMAGLMTLEMGDTDKTYKNIAECREHGMRILPPDVNESGEDFTVLPAATTKAAGRSASASAPCAASARRRSRRSSRRAQRRPVHLTRRLLQTRPEPAGEQARHRELDQVRRLRLQRASRAAACSKASTASASGRGRAVARRIANQMGLFAPGERRGDRRPAAGAAGRAGVGTRRSCCRPSATPSASSSPAIRSTSTSAT